MPLNFRKDNPLRPHLALAGLVAVSVLSLGAYVQEGDEGPLHTLQSGTAAVFTPAKYVSGAISGVEYSAFTAIGDLVAGDATASELRQENEQLRQQVAELEEYRQESERLKDLLAYRDTYDLEGEVCTVISRTGKSWNNTITIGKGTASGVRSGMAVVGPAGVVGQVSSANSHTAEVRLLQDPNSGVAVLIQSSRVEGIVRGSLDGMLYLENIPDDAEVKEGDIVVTSGLGGSFNRGLMVGRVAKVEGASGGPTRKIIIEPNESTGPLQEVMVISGMGSEGAAAEGVVGEDLKKDDEQAATNEEESAGEEVDSTQQIEG